LQTRILISEMIQSGNKILFTIFGLSIYLIKPVFYLIQISILALVYFVSGKLSFMIAGNDLVVTIVYFASEGFALAAVLIFGRKLWLGIFFGQLILALSTNMHFYPAILISAVNSIEALIAVSLFNYFGLDKSLKHLRDVIGLLLLIVLVLQPFSSILGNFILLVFDVSNSSSFYKNVFSWWFGNAIGQILFTPFLLLLYAHGKDLSLRDVTLTVCFFLVLNYLILVLFPIKSLPILLCLTMPIVVLIAAFRNITTAYIATIIIAIIALYATFKGTGVFQHHSNIDNIIDLNFYILSHILLVLIIGTLFDEKRVVEEKLKSMALYDNLTGLANRNLLKEHMQHIVSLGHLYQTRSAVCFFDIDGFKQVNDTYGHNFGDEVLKQTVKRIQNNIRADDLLLRLGGDEFLLIFVDIKTNEALNSILKKILVVTNQPITINHDTVTVSLSIGVSIYPDNSKKTDELIKFADDAMYKAKHGGKHRFVYYNGISHV